MKQLIGSALCVLMTAQAWAAVRGDNAMYVGGTVSTLKEGVQGELDLTDKEGMIFVTRSQGSVTIPYAQITEIQAGLKSGYRVGLTIALAATTLGLAALPVLLAKKKKHYLTISYRDGSDNAVMILELAKGIERQTTAIIEARSGKKLTVEGARAETVPMIAKIDHTPISNPRATESPVVVAEAPKPTVANSATVPPVRETKPGEFRPRIFGLD